MKGRKGFTLIELMIVIAIIAIIAAIAIPGLLKAKISSQERNASTSLKSLTTAETSFQSNDVDRNGQQDFWTANLAGLFCIKSLATGDPIRELGDVSMASADLAIGAGLVYLNDDVEYDEALLLDSTPKAGYFFQALVNDQNGDVYAVDTGDGEAVHNFGKYGFFAIPVSQGSTGDFVFIVSEVNTVFKREFSDQLTPTPGTVLATFNDAGIATDYPDNTSISDDWAKVE